MRKRAGLGFAVALAIIGAAVSCTEGPGSASPPLQSPSPSPSSNATVEPEATPAASPSGSPEVTSSPDPVPADYNIRAYPLGRLSGNWIFVGKQVRRTDAAYRSQNQIWAVPLDGGPAKLAFTYDVGTAGIPEAIFDNTPYLRRQFSPDARRMVISIAGQLVVVDLVSGRVTFLGTSGYFPAWSKDGSHIAFVFYLPVDQVVPPEEAIGVIPAGGGPVTQLAKVGYSGRSVEWSPDGSMAIVAQMDRTVIVAAGTGKVLRELTQAPYEHAFAHWRTTSPQIAFITARCDEATTKIIGLDDPMLPERMLLDTQAQCPALSIRDPRWNPAKASELLYVATRAEPGRMPHEYRAHLLDVVSGRDTVLPFDAYEATWTWDGERIAYLTANVQLGFGDSVNVSRRDGSGSRNLLTATGDDFFFSVASVNY